jgi:hypothetical protein
MWIKAIHITLAILVYFSSIGVTLNKHFCKGELKNVALITKAKSCEGICHTSSNLPMIAVPVKEHSSCCANDTPEADENDTHKGCCEEESEYVQVEVVQTITKSADLLQLIPAVFVLIPSLQVLLPADLPLGIQWQFLNFHPPSLTFDRSVLFDTFLI